MLMAGPMIINFTLSKKSTTEKSGLILISLYKKLMISTTGRISKAIETKMLRIMTTKIKP